jgi:hypothetical protein
MQAVVAELGLHYLDLLRQAGPVAVVAISSLLLLLHLVVL